MCLPAKLILSERGEKENADTLWVERQKKPEYCIYLKKQNKTPQKFDFIPFPCSYESLPLISMGT